MEYNSNLGGNGKKLPNKKLSEIVEYYYVVWKTSPEQKLKMKEKQKSSNNRILEYTCAKLGIFENCRPVGFESTATQQIQCISCEVTKSAAWFHRANLVTSPASTASTAQSTAIATKRNHLAVAVGASSPTRELKQLKPGALIAPSSKRAAVTSVQSPALSQPQPLPTLLASDSASSVSAAAVSKAAAMKKFENVCNPCWVYWKKHGIFKNGTDPSMPSNL